MINIKEQLTNAGFIFKEVTVPGELKLSFLKRYPDIPNQYLDFLLNMKSCVNCTETAWFNSVDDFNREDRNDNDFAWNEFEIQSLEATEGDEESETEVKKFWNRHLPIFLSVEDGYYSYFSICVEGEEYGKIYSGSEPEYEEVTFIAETFTDFIDKLVTNTLTI